MSRVQVALVSGLDQPQQPLQADRNPTPIALYHRFVGEWGRFIYGWIWASLRW